MNENLDRRLNNFVVPILLSLMLGLGSWTLARIASIQNVISAIEVTLSNEKEVRNRYDADNTATHRSFESKLNDLVSRREFELQISSLKAQILTLEARIGDTIVALRSLEVRMVALELQAKNQK